MARINGKTIPNISMFILRCLNDFVFHENDTEQRQSEKPDEADSNDLSAVSSDWIFPHQLKIFQV